MLCLTVCDTLRTIGVTGQDAFFVSCVDPVAVFLRLLGLLVRTPPSLQRVLDAVQCFCNGGVQSVIVMSPCAVGY